MSVVLTQKKVEGKLERASPTQEGKRSCKRNSEHLQENVRWKQSNWSTRAKSHKPKWQEIWQLQTVRSIIGVSSFPSKESRHFLAVDINCHKRRKFGN